MKRKIFTHWSQIALPILYGVILGFVLVAWSQAEKPLKPIALASSPPAGVSAYPVSFMAMACSTDENANLKGRELVAPKKKVVPPKRRVAARLPFYEKYVPVPKGQNPNSVRLHKSQAPFPHGAKSLNGKFICGKKGDKPDKSDKFRKNHIDMQCCLDPDEIPNPHCTYN